MSDKYSLGGQLPFHSGEANPEKRWIPVKPVSCHEVLETSIWSDFEKRYFGRTG